MEIHKIYSELFAHRGLHINYPENTIPSCRQAVKQNFSIEIDVRFTKDEIPICFHDIYMSRLLSVPGKISSKTYEQIKDYKVLKSNYTIPTLKEILELVDGKVSILIEVKGYMNKEHEKALKEVLKDYNGQLYFHANNFLTFSKCRKIWGDDVFWIYNFFRRRFQFVKGKDYKKIYSVPTIDDIIVEAEDNARTVIRKIWKTFNRYTTRVKDDHFLLSYNGKKNQNQHRAIVDPSLKENSKEALLECVKMNKVIELDVIDYKDELVCYHDDRVTKKLGQKSSIAQKLAAQSSITFKESLKTVDGKVPLIIDIKPPKIFFVMKFLDKVMKNLENYKGKFVIQSPNPIIIICLMKKYPDVVRGQIGHSLNGLKKFRNVLLTIINFCLFYIGKPDYIVYDLDPTVYLLSRFNNILGLPVIGYAPSTGEEILQYKDFFDNFIVEGNF